MSYSTHLDNDPQWKNSLISRLSILDGDVERIQNELNLTSVPWGKETEVDPDLVELSTKLTEVSTGLKSKVFELTRDHTSQ